MTFLDDIIVKPLANGKDWELQYEVRYALPNGRVIYIPASFITDFASIPWFFRRLFQPATGKHRRAAVVHDWIFRTSTEDFTFEECNAIFDLIMVEDEVPKWKRTAMYQAVRFGGKSSYVERTL
tara:strand:+ start:644 stop:1015 length:372 start_codon:yes stop_codon:yes gene_type:complete